MFGADANWGRVLCAIGYSGAEFDLQTAVRLKCRAGEVLVCEGRRRHHPYSEEEAKVLLEDEVIILVDLAAANAHGHGLGL